MELAKSPQDHRASPLIVSGRAQQVEVVDLLPELVPLYQFRKYYRVTIVAKDAPHPVVIATRQIPALWKDVKTLDEPVTAQAIFLKAGETAEEKTPLYFVAPRLAWFPDKVSEELSVNEDLVWLAQRGMDIALWDDVRANNGSGIDASEGECFYQLLTRLKTAKPEERKQLKAAAFDLPAMLQKPNELLGQAFTCTGTARRVQKVSVPEQYRERLGLDHYYEIDMFLPLDHQAIRLSSKPGDKNAPTFTDGFPVTVNVPSIPADLEPGRNVHHQVRLKGVFFKLWAYQSEFISGHDKSQRQPSPLLMGADVHVLPPEAGPSWGPWTKTILMAAVVVGILGVWFFAWRAMRGDKKFERKVLRKYTHGETNTPAGFEPPQISDKEA